MIFSSGKKTNLGTKAGQDYSATILRDNVLMFGTINEIIKRTNVIIVKFQLSTLVRDI